MLFERLVSHPHTRNTIAQEHSDLDIHTQINQMTTYDGSNPDGRTSLPRRRQDDEA
jgi:hypothetical protein